MAFQSDLDVIDVRDPIFGGVQAGFSADWTANRTAVQRAIDAADGRTVYVPAGEYYFDGPLHLRRRVQLLGAGRMSTLLHFPTNTTGLIVDPGGSGSRIVRIRIEGRGLSPVTPGHGVLMLGSTALEQATVNFFSGAGIRVLTAPMWYVATSHAINSGSDGLYIRGGDTSAGTVIAVNFSNNGRRAGAIFRSLGSKATWTPENWGVVVAPLPAGLPVRSIAPDPTTPHVVYVGTDAGVFRSDDNIATWVASGHGPAVAGGSPLSVSALAISPFSHGLVYAATPQGVHRTVDGGTTWVPVSTGLSDTYVTALVHDPVQEGIMYAGTASGMFKTSNAEAAPPSEVSWHATTLGPHAVRAIATAIEGDPYTPVHTLGIFAGTSDGLFRSTDGGQTWSRLGPKDGPGMELAITALAGEVGASNVLYVATPAGVYRTMSAMAPDPATVSWDAISSGLPTVSGTPVAIAQLVADASTPGIVYGATVEGIYKTMNGLATSPGTVIWQSANTGLGTQAVTALASTPAVLLAGTGMGLFSSSTWFQSDRDMEDSFGTPPITALATDSTTPTKVYAGTPRGLFTSTNGGRSWTPPKDTGLEIHSLIIDPVSLTILAGTTRQTKDGPVRALLSSVDGEAWMPVPGPTGTMTALLLDGATSDLYVGTADAGLFWRSSGVWKQTQEFWVAPSSSRSHVSIRALAFDPATKTLYVGASNGLFRWNGTTMKLQVEPAIQESVLSILIDTRTTPSTIAVGVYSEANRGLLFTSTDGGLSWTDSKPPLYAGCHVDWISSLLGDPASPGGLYVGTDRGFFAVSASPRAWSCCNNGLPATYNFTAEGMTASFGVTALIITSTSPVTLLAGLTNPGGFGVFDDSQYGNTYVGCHTRENVHGSFALPQVGSGSVLVGGYAEVEQASSVGGSAAIALGGQEVVDWSADAPIGARVFGNDIYGSIAIRQTPGSQWAEQRSSILKLGGSGEATDFIGHAFGDSGFITEKIGTKDAWTKDWPHGWISKVDVDGVVACYAFSTGLAEKRFGRGQFAVPNGIYVGDVGNPREPFIKTSVTEDSPPENGWHKVGDVALSWRPVVFDGGLARLRRTTDYASWVCVERSSTDDGTEPGRWSGLGVIAGSEPTITVAAPWSNAAAGVRGNDLSGVIEIFVTEEIAGSDVPVAGPVVKVAFSIVFSVPPNVIVQPASKEAWDLPSGYIRLLTSSIEAAGFTLTCGGPNVPPRLAGIYRFTYMVLPGAPPPSIARPFP